ncbi:MAG: acyltransferase [Hyphomicrobiales bacterium]|nr:acyltransferase [Hyphomicrobiales bacterium]
MTHESASPDRTAAKRDARNAGIDALRGCVALLVVLHHAAIIYGAQGGWYYYETPHSGRLSSLLLTFFCSVNQAWFMGLFFLLAGYFTPPAVARRGRAAFALERLTRLGLPMAGYALLLHPLTVALAQSSKGQPFAETFARLWGHGQFRLGPLWFAFALLLLSALYLAVAGKMRGLRVFPSNRALLAAAILTGAGAFLLRLRWPVGVEVASLQLGYFASYIVLFALGCMAADARLLEAIPAAQVRLWRRIAWLAAPVLPIAALAQDRAGVALGRFEGGGNAAALIYALWEPFIAWGIILGLIFAFQKRFATLQGAWAQLARRSFAIYVIHPPILTGVAVAWRSVSAPPLLKFGATGAIACLLCYIAAGLVLRIPGVNRVL